jgi:hypothetical protein
VAKNEIRKKRSLTILMHFKLVSLFLRFEKTMLSLYGKDKKGFSPETKLCFF